MVWARLSFQRFWPAIVVDPLTCGQSTTKPGYCWVFWFGDYKVSEVSLWCNAVDRIYGVFPVLSERVLQEVECWWVFKINKMFVVNLAEVCPRGLPV